MQTQILIVGAGPTGLVLALWLKKKGIHPRIIDKSLAPGLTSRALAVQARTLEFYRQMGIADDIIERGVVVKEIKMRRNGQVVATAPLGAIGENQTPFPYLIFLSQDVHEKLLVHRLIELGVEVEWGTELLSFDQDDKGVSYNLKTPRGEETARVAYLCGCDGAHSTVRHGIGSDFPGGTYSQVFFVADVKASGPAMEGGVQISVSADSFCIVMPIQVHGSVRLTGLIPPEKEKQEKFTFDDVAESVQRNTGLRIHTVNWFSSYHVHHRVASHFRKDRVFLAGDAGHIHSPAGGQGMNTGIGDAVNLAWKLADVINGRSGPEILETYEPERIAFARVLVKTTDTAFKFIASRTIAGSLFRAYVLPKLFARLTKTKTFLQFAFKTLSQTRIKYRSSALSSGALGKLHGGDRLPFVNYGTFTNFDKLKSMDWQVHVYGSTELPWNEDCAAKGLVKGAEYVIRPDGHIASITPPKHPGGPNEPPGR